MPAIQSLDTYLERSTSLLESDPENTLVSVTYRNKGGKSKESSKGENQEESKGAESGCSNSSTTRSVSFKTYNDGNGICYRFTTNKAKDLSRVLTALGPKGVQFTKSKKIPSKKRKSEADNISGNSSKKSKKKSKSELDDYSVKKYSVNGKGFSSILSNVECKPEEADDSNNAGSKTQKAETVTKTGNAGSTKSEETSSKKKKSKKKKGKK